MLNVKLMKASFRHIKQMKRCRGGQFGGPLDDAAL